MTTRPATIWGPQLALFLLGLLLFVANKPLGVFVGLGWLLPIIIAIDLGVSRDRKGWTWGLVLGWLGVLILACMRAQR